jgi:hypothetical protein
MDGGQAACCGIAQAGLQLQGGQQGREGEAGQANAQDQTANATDDDLPGLQRDGGALGHVQGMLSVSAANDSHFCGHWHFKNSSFLYPDHCKHH